MKNINLKLTKYRLEILKFLEREYVVDPLRLSILSEDEMTSIMELSLMKMLDVSGYNNGKEEGEKKLNMGFFEVVYISEFEASFMDLNDGELYNVNDLDSEKFKLNDIIFGVLEPDEEDDFYSIIRENAYHLNLLQRDEVIEIYEEYDVDDDFGVFTDIVIHKNYLKYHMNMVLDLQVKQGDSLLLDYEYYEIERSFDILVDTAMIAYRTDQELSIYNMDYNLMFEELCKMDVFLVEGEPEIFITILLDVFKRAAAEGTECTFAIKSLEAAKDNIFNFKKIILDRGINQTSKELIDLIDKKKNELNHNLIGIFTLVDLIHAIYHVSYEDSGLQLTKSKRHFTSSTIRDLAEISNFFKLDEYRNVSQGNIPIINFLYHLLVQKEFVVIVDQMFMMTAKYNSLVRTSMDVLVAHILNYMLDVKVISGYLGVTENEARSEIDMVMGMMESEKLDFTKGNTKKILELLEVLSLLENDGEKMVLAPMGKLYCEYLYPKSISKEAKILNLSDYRK